MKDIREGIAFKFWELDRKGCDRPAPIHYEAADETLSYLKDHDIVQIDRDRELPTIDKQDVGEYLKQELGYNDIAIGLMRDDIARYIKKKVKKITAGYVAVKDII